MFTIEVRFPARRYHASRWQTHVNEGMVEWPPSPWRLVRALYAVGHTHRHWRGDVPEEFAEFVEAVAIGPPEYRVPAFVQTHTRHYMPIIEGKKQTTTKVFDTFNRIVDDRPMLIRFPKSPSAAAVDLVGELAGDLAYLGRAESWVEVAVRDANDQDADDADDDDAWFRPVEHPAPGIGEIQTRLLSPTDTAFYNSWRAESLKTSLASERERRGKKLTKAQEAKVRVKYPASMLDCVGSDTAWLQSCGWSQPPGTRWIDYQGPEPKPPGTKPDPSRRSSVSTTASGTLPTHAIIQLTSDSVSGRTLPPRGRTVRVAEAFHDAVMHRLQTTDGSGLPPALRPGHAGAGDGRRQQHQHLHVLPIGRDDPRCIDHLLLHAPGGIDPITADAIKRVRAIYSKNLPKTHTTWIGSGGARLVRRFLQEGRTSLPLIESDRFFTSHTPYVASRHLKPINNRYTLVDNIVDECRHRGLPRPEVVVWDRNRGRFFLSRQKKGKAPPRVEGWKIDLMFPEPVSADPLTLGYGAHFGLGLFRRSRGRDDAAHVSDHV